MDTDGPSQQGIGALVRADHDELAGLGKVCDLFCLKTEQAVFSPELFVGDEGFLFFVHVSNR